MFFRNLNTICNKFAAYQGSLMLVFLSFFLFNAASSQNVNAYKMPLTHEKSVNETSDISETTPISARIVFKNPMPIEAAAQVFRNKNAGISFLVWNWEGHTAFYQSQTHFTSPSEFEAKKAEHIAFLTRKITKWEGLFGGSENENKESVFYQALQQNIASFKAQKSFIEKNGIYAMEATILATPSVLREIYANENVFEAYVKNTAKMISPPNPQTLTAGPAVPMPVGGDLYWSDGAYVGSDCFWHNSTFPSTDVGYEHDIRVTEGDFWKDKTGGTAYTYFPSAYIDTRCSDPSNPEYYTIGTEASYQIGNLTMYYTEMPIDVQNSNKSSTTVKVTPQLGHWASMTNYSTNQFSPSAELGFCAFPITLTPSCSGLTSNTAPACIFATNTSTSLPLNTVNRNTSGSIPWGEPGTCTLSSPSNGAAVGSSRTFTWTSTGYANQFNIQISTNSSFSNLVLNYTGGGGNAKSMTVSGFVVGQTYYWRVREQGVFTGWKSFSSYRSFYRPSLIGGGSINGDVSMQRTEDGAISINPHELIENVGLSIYPNPNDGKTLLTLMVVSQSGGTSNIEIFNSAGERVYISETTLVEGSNEININSMALKSGLYIVKVGNTTSGEIFTDKLLIE